MVILHKMFGSLLSLAIGGIYFDGVSGLAEIIAVTESML